MTFLIVHLKTKFSLNRKQFRPPWTSELNRAYISVEPRPSLESLLRIPYPLQRKPIPIATAPDRLLFV